MNVALLFFCDGAVEPRTGCAELPGTRQAVAHVVQAFAEALVIDAAVNVALLGLRDSALEPRTGGTEFPCARQAIAHQVQTLAQARPGRERRPSLFPRRRARTTDARHRIPGCWSDSSPPGADFCQGSRDRHGPARRLSLFPQRHARTTDARRRTPRWSSGSSPRGADLSRGS